MIRYCPNCRKDYDFKIKSIKDLDSLVCPECGSQIGKNSKNPDRDDSDKIENGIGNVIAVFFRLMYLFYFLFAVPAIIFYFVTFAKGLYVCTAINLIFYVITMVSGTSRFRLGMILLPVGAFAAYFLLGTLQGACLGIQIVFLVYFLIRGLILDILFRLIGKAVD